LAVPTNNGSRKGRVITYPAFPPPAFRQGEETPDMWWRVWSGWHAGRGQWVSASGRVSIDCYTSVGQPFGRAVAAQRSGVRTRRARFLPESGGPVVV